MPTTVVDVTAAASAPYAFFASILAGIVLAVGFQLLFTQLMAAIGLSAASVATDPDSSSAFGERSGGRGTYSNLRKINSMFGMWTLVTTSVSLFAAVWLAVAMNPYLSWIHGLVVGLVIWSVTYMISVVLEWKVGTSMIGMIAGIARSSLQALGDLTGSVFGKSEARQKAQTAEAIAASVRQELFGNVDVRREIRKFMQQIRPVPRDFRKELEKLLDRVEITSTISEHDHSRFTATIRTNSSAINKEKARALASGLRDAIAAAKEEAGTEKPRYEKIADSAMRAAGLSPQEAEEARHRLEDYLRQTGKEELNPDGIKRDLERMFADPKSGKEILQARLSQMDRGTAAAVIAQRMDMSESEARKKVDMIMSTIDSLIGRARGKGNGKDGQNGQAAGAKARALDQIEEYLAGLDRPSERLDPEAVRAEFELLLSDPVQGAKALFHRAKQLDDEELKTLLSSNQYIDREDVDRLHKKILETRDQVASKVQQMEKEIEKRTEQLREEALYHTDQVRMTLSSAAWWLFGTAVVSGVAAALAGWIGTSM